MDRKLPAAAVIAKHLKLRPTRMERAAGYASGADMIETIVDKGVHTWIDEDDEPQTADCWAVITIHGGKHYIPKSEVA